MPTLQFKNNASTTLSGSINDTQTSVTVISSASFPVPAAGDYFYATMYEVSGAVEINIEIVKVTSVIGNVWTIVRAQDSSTARSRNGVATCYIENRMTAASAQLMTQRDNNLSDLVNATTARTNLGLGTMATQNAAAVAITGGTISGVTIAGVDSTTTIADNADSTKKVAFEVSGVTTATTRTLTIPNASGTIALTSDLTAGYQPLDSDLTAVAGLAANGIIARTGTGTMAVRALAAPVAGFAITNSDGVAGNPTFALANDLAAVEGIATTGFVRRTGVDTWSASAIVDGDLPAALTGKTYNALTLTANATGFSAAGGTTSKTLTVSNSITLAGTDGTTITLPTTTGTVALNNQTMFIGTTAVAINRATAALALTGVSIDGAAGSATTATTATKATNLVGGNNTTLLGAIGYQSNTDTTTLLAPNVTATKLFLAQTGTGINGAAPVWSAVSKSDVGLSLVENTALSTWAGSTSITSVGTVATGTWNATAIGIAKGGTGAITAVAAFDALAPTTTLGDVIYHDGTDNVRLAGNITSTRRFFRQTGTGTVSAAPAWDTLTDPDIPSALTGKTYNSLTLTAASVGFSVAGGATSKTLTMSNTLTLAGTDGSTLNVGAGGTLGTAAYTASTAYAPAAGSASIVTVGTITSGTWTGSAIGLSNGGTGATSKIAAFDALSPAITLGDLIYSDGADNVRLAGNTLASKRFLTQTGTGTVSAAPGWNALIDGDLPSALTGKTYNGLTLTANAAGFAVAGGTIAKTLTISNNLTFAGTDGSTLNIGAGGTLGSAAYTASTAYAPAAGSASVTTLGTVTTGTWNATAIAAAYGGTGQTSYAVGDLLYASGTTALSKLAGVATGNALISGGVTTAPAWGKIGLTTHVSGTLPVANGGTGVTTSTGTGNVVLSASPTLTGTATVASIAPSGNIAFTGTGNRITADFSNATASLRAAFQTSTTNGITTVPAIPNGTATAAYFIAHNASTVDNSSYFYMGATAGEAAIRADRTGTASYLPITFYTTAAERMRIDASGNVGIGTATPGAYKLNVSGAGVNIGATGTGNPSLQAVSSDAAGIAYFALQNGTRSWSIRDEGTSGALSFRDDTAVAERMRIDIAGNVGIGVPSPSAKLDIGGSVYVRGAPAAGALFEIAPDPTAGANGVILNASFVTGSHGPMRFFTGATDRMRIDAAGNLLFEKTAANISAQGIEFKPGGYAGFTGNLATTNELVNFNNANTGNVAYDVAFRQQNVIAGSIRTNSASVSYNTTSDHRLKENILPIASALAKVAALKPVTYTWKVDGSDGEGFIAHELQEVCPLAVTGEKDAVGQDGKPVHQSIDPGKIIGLLTAAIQEQQQIISRLNARLDAAGL